MTIDLHDDILREGLKMLRDKLTTPPSKKVLPGIRDFGYDIWSVIPFGAV